MVNFFDYCVQNGKSYLLKEWNYSLNGDLNPKNIPHATKMKVWWKCSNCGKEWQASISNRIMKTGCPVCSRKILSQKKSQPKGNSLLAKSPEIAKEWIYEKNGDLLPENVTYKSHQRAWFKCSNCGFEWETRVENRVNFGCPNCRNKRISIRNATPKQGQSLKDLFPEIAKEWDYEKNSQCPEDVRPYSEENVWWLCGVCGHSYRRVINVRTVQNATCPKCSAKGTSYGEQYIYWAIKCFFPNAKNRCKYWGIEYDVVVDYPETRLMIEYSGYNWHKGKEKKDLEKRIVAEKNGFSFVDIVETYNPCIEQTICHFELKPDSNRDYALNDILNQILSRYDLSIESLDLLEIRKKALDYSKGFVEKEKSLAFLFPAIAEEWDYDANFPLTPENVTAFSGINVQWRCNKGHQWTASIGSRTSNKNGCPYCSNHSCVGIVLGVNDLATTDPSLVSYWNSDKNGDIKPTNIRRGSYYKAWWKCPNCGYEWQAIVRYKVIAKFLCPQCGLGKIINGPAKKRETKSLIGQSKMMNCGLIATIIEDNGYHDITIRFEDGMIRYHCRKDRFKEGAIAHKAN